MNVTIRQLRYLKVAADSRSITMAAKQLNISQSSIGAGIDRIEQEFKLQIFIRQPSKGLLLTQSGRLLMIRVNALLAEVDSFAREANGLQTQLSGELNVGCFAPLSPHFLPQIFKDLTTEHPDVSIHLQEGDLQQVQQLLLNGSIDVSLSYDLTRSSQLTSEVLGSAPPHVILSKNDPLSGNESIDLKELHDKPMVLFDVPESHTYFQLIFKSVGIVPKIVHRTETYEMVRSMVGAGIGFSLLNLRPLVNNTYNGSEVVCRPISNKVLIPNLIIARRRQEISTKLVDAFVTSCRDYFQSPNAARHIVTCKPSSGVFAPSSED